MPSCCCFMFSFFKARKAVHPEIRCVHVTVWLHGILEVQSVLGLADRCTVDAETNVQQHTGYLPPQPHYMPTPACLPASLPPLPTTYLPRAYQNLPHFHSYRYMHV